MASTAGDDGSEDVNDFLARIRELGDQRDQEDEERTRKLEEEIMKGRQERAARRAERARSISPSKDSPASVLGSSTTAPKSVIDTPTPRAPDMLPPKQALEAPASNHLAMEPNKPVPPAQSSLSRSNTLSWQQRPSSRTSTTVRSRPLSVVATENSALRSPSATPEPTLKEEKSFTTTENSSTASTPTSRPATRGISATSVTSMLADKDPSWFRQTADRGVSSAAYRRSEEPEQGGLARSGSIRMPGMSQEPSYTAKKEVSDTLDSSSRDEPLSSNTRANLDSIRLDPPINEREQSFPTMSPSQGRISPDRMDRPLSPTKGLGGFVQSAMLKRSDSVSKRWSTQAQGGLGRGNSSAGNRNSRDLGVSITSYSGNARSPSPTKESTLVEPTKEDSHSLAKSQSKTSLTDVQDAQATSIDPVAAPKTTEISTPRPASPVKDAKRWSPVKSSWLENAINKPDSPRPQKPATPQQPAWMAELQKAKAARASVDISKSQNTTDHTPTPTYNRHESIHASRMASSLHEEGSSSTPYDSSAKEPLQTLKFEESLKQPENKDEAGNDVPTKDVTVSLARAQMENPLIKPKPETPPKKDFRSSLKARPADSGASKEDVPEFKKAFGNLRRTETKTYVAPDKLKENITRGKAGLNTTGGPQKTQLVDEFKESIVAKKKEFSTAPSKPPVKNPSQTSSKPVPEALAKRTGMLNRTQSVSKPESPATNERPTSSAERAIDQAPFAVQSSQLKNSALAARFNPNLVGLLARGPPGTKSSSSENFNPSGTAATPDPPTSKGPELTHATKGRARGPKRKPPSSKQSVPSVPQSPSASNLAKTTSATVTASSQSKPFEPSEEKMKSYNEIKSSLMGGASNINNLGISGVQESSPSHVSKTVEKKFDDDLSSKRLSINKSKPPAPKSPSNRVSSISKPPTSAIVKSVEPVAEPLNILTTTKNKVNLGEKPATPVKRSSADTEARSPPAVSASPKPRHLSLSPEMKRPSSGIPTAEQKQPTPAKSLQKPSQPPSPDLKRVRSPPQQVKPLKVSQSPAVPTKSIAARSFSSVKEEMAPAGMLPVRHVIEDFFGPTPESKVVPNIDTQNILNSKSKPSDKIRSLRKQIWELTPDGKQVPLPAQQQHILFEKCMYVCTHVFGSAAGKHTTEAYLWVGDGVSPSAAEDSQLFARNIAKEAGAAGRLLVLRQGKETSNFFEALGGIVITRKGSGKDANDTYMLCGRKHMGQMAFDEVDFSSRSLCSGFPFIVAAAGGMLYLWKGKGSGADELGCARLIAMDLGLTGEVEEVDDGQESAMFWVALGDSELDESRVGHHWPTKATKESFTTRLYSIDDARPRSAGLGALWGRRAGTPGGDDPGTTDIHEISPFAQSDLAQDGIYVLDAYFEIYVILCWRSSARFPAFRTAAYFAQEYAILASSEEDRPFVPAAHIVFAGASSPYLKTAFRKWDESRVTTQPVGSLSDASTIPVHEAIAVITERN